MTECVVPSGADGEGSYPFYERSTRGEIFRSEPDWRFLRDSG